MSLFEEQNYPIVPQKAQEMFTLSTGKLIQAAYLRSFTVEQAEQCRRK